ncbi:ATP-binding cassette domain-containing protein [Oceanobacillus picturae]|uniref:ATP-binding cassette domain-containing protein n=1 Tax=Oceanobacillus picturae TaxID=171693 RepID=UPI000E69B12F|nr:ABC transporter ATP-binding protein [Oceanobacillus picturae]RIU91155.1 ABC transporter ATP-binding protein [Oceanobacillus picturae]
MLKLKDISVAYKDKKVLDKLSLTADKGEIIGLVAPNGTGKTTLFNVIANFLKPNSGTVNFQEKHTYRSEKEEIRIHKQLATFPDQSDLIEELSGMDHLKLYANMWQKTTKHIPSIIEKLHMTGYVKKKVRTYSLGMRQRLCFAMMEAADTPMMLMDEVMNGLDLSNVALISQHLNDMKKKDKLIFVASHLLENLDLYADRVLFLKDGKIIHEQHFHGDSDAFIKISLEEEQYQLVKETYGLPDGYHFIANHLLCIPIKDMLMGSQAEWLDRLLPFHREITIGPLGTMEYYEKHFHS